MIEELKTIPALMTGLLESYLKDDDVLDPEKVKAFEGRKALDDMTQELKWVVAQLIEFKNHFGFEGSIDGVSIDPLKEGFSLIRDVYLKLQAVRIRLTSEEVYTQCYRETSAPDERTAKDEEAQAFRPLHTSAGEEA